MNGEDIAEFNGEISDQSNHIHLSIVEIDDQLLSRGIDHK